MVVATGFFDGVHIGHRVVISTLCRIAAQRGEKSSVVTFWPHPRNVLQQDADKLRLLTSMEEKRTMLLEMGVDSVEVIPFTLEFSRLSAEEFVRQFLKERFGASAIVLGYDHRIGGGKGVTKEELDATIRAQGLDVFRAGELSFGDNSISSTKIRNLLAAGDVSRANEMLGYCYGLHGVVVSGDKIGKGILSCPTANIELYEPLKLVPADGVYAVEAQVLGKTYYGMTNIGFRPTVASMLKRTIETHLFDFDSDIYGLDFKIRFLARLRSEMRFPSMDALKCQLNVDMEHARKEILLYSHNKLKGI